MNICNLIINVFLRYVSSSEISSSCENIFINTETSSFDNEYLKNYETSLSEKTNFTFNIEPVILNYDKLLNNGTFTRILLVKEAEVKKNNSIYILCDTKFDKLSKDLKMSFKIHYYNLKLKVLKNSSSLSSVEIKFYNGIINKIKDIFDEECKLSIFNYELRNATKSAFKEFETTKNNLKVKFQKEHLKNIIDENLKLVKRLAEELENINFNIDEETRKNEEAGSTNQKIENDENIIDLKENNESENVIDLKECDEFLNWYMITRKYKKLHDFYKENSDFFESYDSTDKNNDMTNNKTLKSNINKNIDSKYEQHHSLVYKDLFAFIKIAQIKIYYILQKYKNYFFIYIEESYKKELHELKKNFFKYNFNGFNNTKQKFEKAQEFFYDSKNTIKCKINTIIDNVKMDLIKSLLS